MRVYSERHGSGPELVLVHGWGLNGEVWSPVIKALSENFSVTVIDLPGYARSCDMPGCNTLESAAEEIVNIMPPAIWVGLSLGGMIAMTAAARWPEQVVGLVLVSTTPKFVRSGDWEYGMEPLVLEGFFKDLQIGYQQTLSRFLSLQIGVQSPSRQLLRDLRQQIFKYPPPNADVLTTGLDWLQHADIRPLLGKIPQPVLVVHGDRDRLVPQAAARYMTEMLADARLEVVADAGHLPFLVEPAAFVTCCQGFFAHD